MTEQFRARKFVGVVEETFHEFGPDPGRTVMKGAMLAVVTNPYAGRYTEDFSPASAELEALGFEMGNRLIALLGSDVERIDGYGKGAIVGDGGELEHGAIWHIPGGTGMRKALGKGTAIVPSTKKVGGIGSTLDIPLTHLEWNYVGSHYDAMEVGVSDAPRAGEMVLVLGMSVGGRINERLAGGFTLEDRGKDGVPV